MRCCALHIWLVLLNLWQCVPAPQIKTIDAVDILYYAPFLSRSGYSVEAFNFISSILNHVLNEQFYMQDEGNAGIQVNLGLKIVHFGDAAVSVTVDESVLSAYGISMEQWRQIFISTKEAEKKINQIILTKDNDLNSYVRSKLIVICHSSLLELEKCPAINDAAQNEWIYSVARTMFETDMIYHHLSQALNRFHAVLVPSKFQVDSFSKSGTEKEKLFVVHEPFNTELVGHAPNYNVNDDQGSEYRRFVFLSVFKWELRKGWDLLLQAFAQEFVAHGHDNHADVKLSILTFPHFGQTPKDICVQIAEFLYRNLLLTNCIQEETYHTNNGGLECQLPYWLELSVQSVPQSEMFNIYQRADAFVLPSRGEGWGRPYLESMLMGVPVIGTNWSGMTEFMNHSNSFLISADGLETIQADWWNDAAGLKWANPSIKELREQMRFVYSNRNSDVVMQKIRTARETAMQYSPERVGKQFVDVLKKQLEKHWKQLRIKQQRKKKRKNEGTTQF